MKHPVDVHVGQKIRHRRWLVGMTQQGLAEAVGIKFQQIQKYESGANRCSASRLYDISKAMNVPVSWFFEGLDDQPTEAPEEPGKIELEIAARIARLPTEQLRAVVNLLAAVENKDGGANAAAA